MFLPLLLAGYMLTASAEAPSGAPADEALKLEVRRLVRQLDAPQLAEREVAEEALAKLGPTVLEVLPAVNERTPAEVRQRLARLRQKLERATAEAAAKPTLVTLHGPALPLSKALRALQEQSGNPIVDFRQRFGQALSDPALNVEFDKTPFWEALDRVLDQAGLTVYGFGPERAIHVVARGEGLHLRSGAACYSGPFRFEPILVSAQRDLRDPSGDLLALTLEVAWEPRLRPIGLRQPLGQLLATDESGNTRATDNKQAELEVPVSEESVTAKLVLPFKLPPRDVRQIASLKGALRAMIPGKIETFRFDDLPAAKNVEKRLAGVIVTLEQVVKNNELWQVRMRVRFDQPGNALESHRGWIFKNEAYLEDPDGKPVSYDGFETTRQTENEVGIAYGFVLNGPPKGYMFVYKTPGAIVSSSFEYELKGIKLP
jgi:hypothetical protein